MREGECDDVMELFKRLFEKKQLPAIPMPIGEEGKGLSLLIGAATDRGLVRDHNEDALFALNAVLSQEEDLLPTGLYIVADGMGGHTGGEQASALAVRLVANWILHEIYQPFLLDTGRSANRRPINEVLIEAFVAANGKIHETCPESGTTLTCAFILGTNAFIAHVGDSRAYLVSRNSIRQITKDHSLVNRLIELGQITPEEAQVHPQRSVLYRAVGRAGNLEVETYLQSLPSKSSLLLCSDGLWGMVPETDILSIINTEPSPQAACHHLIAKANETGGEDNITVVLIQV
jgi:serine/threonine protein phosphatase PrpC